MDQNSPTIRFSNPIRVENKKEVLKLKISKEDRFLIKNQEPLAAIWRGDNESSAFYAWISKTTEKIIDPKELDMMNHYLQDRIDQDYELEDIVAPLLGIIESGIYQIFYHEPLPCSPPNNKKRIPNYPLANNFWIEKILNNKKSNVWIDSSVIFTQDVTTLNWSRIDFYKESIQAGKRPTIVTMALAELEFLTTQEYLNKVNENEFTSFLALEYGSESIYPQMIIDGHHKAKAYIELNEKPSILNITKLHFKEEFENNMWNSKYVKEGIENSIGEKLYI